MSINIRVLNKAINIIVNSNPTCKTLWQTKGGWEGWLQGELSVMLWNKRKDLGITDICREWHVYGTGEATDLYVITGGSSKHVIELKAHGMDRKPGGFLKLVKHDLDKLDRVDDEFKPCYVYSIVVVVRSNNYSKKVISGLSGNKFRRTGFVWSRTAYSK